MPSRTSRWVKKNLLSNMESTSKATKQYSHWYQSFKNAMENDSFSSVHDYCNTYNRETAISDYRKLVKSIEEVLANSNNNLDSYQRDSASKISLCVNCRLQSIENSNSNEINVVTLKDLKKLKPVLRNFPNWKDVFPILIDDSPSSTPVSLLSNDSGVDEIESYNEGIADGDQLLPPLPRARTLSRIAIKVEKLGIKDETLENPYLTISLRDSDSVILTELQNATPTKVENYHFIFGCNYHVQKYIERIPKGSRLFFELRYTKGNTIKTKCFGVLPTKNFQNGKCFLELYKGKANYHCKDLAKMTHSKPLYMHLNMKLLDEVNNAF